MDAAQDIYEHWMKYKVHGNKWKGCDLDDDGNVYAHVKNAIRARMKDCNGKVGPIKKAIDVYAKVLLDSKYSWNYSWTLHEFLTRKQKNSSELQFCRFLDRGPEDFLTAAAKASKIEAVKQERKQEQRKEQGPITPFVGYTDMPIEEARQLYRDGDNFVKTIIRKVRPEAVE